MLAILADTSISGNISSTSSILTSKASIQRETCETHVGLFVIFAVRKILNSYLDRSHFAANRTVGGGEICRQAGCHEGEIHTDGLDRLTDRGWEKSRLTKRQTQRHIRTGCMYMQITAQQYEHSCVLWWILTRFFHVYAWGYWPLLAFYQSAAIHHHPVLIWCPCHDVNSPR